MPMVDIQKQGKPSLGTISGLGQNGHPRLSWLFQTSFSGMINSNDLISNGVWSNTSSKNQKRPYLVHPQQQLSSVEITVL